MKSSKLFLVVAISIGLLAVLGRFLYPGFLVQTTWPVPKRIIVVTIDTLRADHVGRYGYPRPTSPFLDSLARQGIVFTEALAPMPTTSPSHASIFTGLYPIQHNVLKNGFKLDKKFVTLAETLKPKGFRTAAVVSTDRHFACADIDQGFDIFDEPVLKTRKYRPGNETVDKAIQVLEKFGPEDKVLFWLHLFDPHTPHQPPAEHRRVFEQVSHEEKKNVIDFLRNSHHVPYDYYNNDPATMLATYDGYDGEVLFADTELKRLFDAYTRAGLGDDTLWIITADHGEGLGNHDWPLHGKNIYYEAVHVPLIFFFSNKPTQGLEYDRFVELVDISPTVLDLLGEDPVEAMAQVKELQGTSLVPLFDGRSGAARGESLFLQRRDYDPANRPLFMNPRTANYEDGERFALQDNRYKYIHWTAGPDEFYHIEQDPYELHNILGRSVSLENKYKTRLLDTIDRFKAEKTSAPASVNADMIEKLKSLGYMQ